MKSTVPKTKSNEFPSLVKFAAANVSSLILNQSRLTSAATNWRELLQLPALAELKKLGQIARTGSRRKSVAGRWRKNFTDQLCELPSAGWRNLPSCPFRFFVRSGLRAEERKVFELDARERGSFQHDVLKIFHEQILTKRKRWRDLTPTKRANELEKSPAELTRKFSRRTFERNGAIAFCRARHDRIAAGFCRSHRRAGCASKMNLIRSRRNWISELKDRRAAWEIDLDGGHKLALNGRIDRVDLWRDEKNGDALALVLDYKSSGKKLDAILVEHGIQLQLLAYLSVLRHWKNPQEIFGAEKLIPAGVFYVNLRGQFEQRHARRNSGGAEESRRKAYRHTGRFDAGALEKLDRKRARDQFNYRLTDAGKFTQIQSKRCHARNLKNCSTALKTNCANLARNFFRRGEVGPYRKGKQTPCEFCDYQAACRIDPWTHQFRVLRATSKNTVSDIPESS